MDLKIQLKLYNTLTRKKQIFKPIKSGEVKLYTCGITAYWYAHLGNLRTYLFEDILKRILEYNGYKVAHVMNITDVGHLTSESDTGEDKMEIGAKRERKTVWEIANFYTRAFKKDLKSLNIKSPNIWVKATSTIEEQIKFIQVLEKKGFTYKIADGVYFDTSKIKDYGKLCGSTKRELKAGSRVVLRQAQDNPELYRRIEVAAGKKNPADFALWKFSPPGQKRQMEWDSPWAPPGVRGKAKGFPGWHTECVVMAVKYLGAPFDIHCGGIDHIPIHHSNEIAQAEAALGKNLANFWLHGEFLVLKEGRMGKSEKNIITLQNLIEKGVNPLSYRYLCLTTHYRSKLTFSWKSLQSGQQALNNLYQKIIEIQSNNSIVRFPRPWKSYYSDYQKKFLEFINNDLNTPKALALAWDMIKDKNLSEEAKYRLLISFDEVFGLNLSKIRKLEIPANVKKLIAEREKCRKKNQWEKADALRKKIQEMGYLVEDTKKGANIKKL